MNKLQPKRLLDGILFTAVCLVCLAATPVCLHGQTASEIAARHPYNKERKPWPIPGTIEAENFDEGTRDDPAYFDTTPGSQAPADEHYRDSDVDIGVDPQMNLVDVGWVDAGEWMEYTVAVKESAKYTLAIRIATPKENSHLHFEMNRKNVTGSIAVPNTGCWGSDLHGHHCFQEAVVHHISLTKGVARLRIVAEGKPGEKDLYTVDKFRFELEPLTK